MIDDITEHSIILVGFDVSIPKFSVIRRAFKVYG